MEAWQPGGQVKDPVPDTGPVPVDEDRPLGGEAQVIAADVEVKEIISCKPHRTFRRPKGGEGGIEPCRRAQAEREERSGVFGDLAPAAQVVPIGFQGDHGGHRGCAPQSRQQFTDLLDQPRFPGRRPVGVTQVFQNEDWLGAVIVPGKNSGQEIRIHGCIQVAIDGILHPQPHRRHLAGGRLQEGGLAVIEGDNGSLRRSIAPLHRLETQRPGLHYVRYPLFKVHSQILPDELPTARIRPLKRLPHLYPGGLPGKA